MARGDAAFRAVSATLFGMSMLAGGWLTATMVAGFTAAKDGNKNTGNAATPPACGA